MNLLCILNLKETTRCLKNWARFLKKRNKLILRFGIWIMKCFSLLYWNKEKTSEYKKEAKLIYDNLKDAIKFLADRLKNKIDNYYWG